ncbi:MFS transporter [Pararhizobium polonicum]|uniref:MFS transporter n=1 Tax=Pararhizobium polonicum TaxID=1612624 RepID=A0A1C7NWY9_9HYPH|nr:MFS transporter [Pararhizobium polonicum]
MPVNLSPLSNPDVVLFLISRFLWVSATQIGNVAVGWLIYDVTRSAWALGLVGLAAFAPKLLLTLVSGLAADRYDRRVIMAVCLVVNGLTSLGLVYIVLLPSVVVTPIYALFIVSGVARGFAGPAAQAMVANLVRREQFSRVVGLSSTTGQFAAVGGPALGGFLYVAGPWAPFACAALFFLVASGLNLMIRRPSEGPPRDPVKLSDVFSGLVFIWQRPVVLGAISLDLFSVLLGGATALLPIIASELLHAGPLSLGILRSMPALGSMMLGLFLSYRPIERHAGMKLFTATTIFGMATIALGLSTNLYLSLAILWLIGASDVFSVVIRQTLVQSDTPDAMRGRVAAVNSLFVGASNELGEFESGITAALFGLVPAILLGGLGTVAISVAWALMFPRLRQRDHLVESRLQ